MCVGPSLADIPEGHAGFSVGLCRFLPSTPVAVLGEETLLPDAASSLSGRRVSSSGSVCGAQGVSPKCRAGWAWAPLLALQLERNGFHRREGLL